MKFEFRGSRVRLVATDRYRLAIRELTWSPASTDISVDVLIPGRTLTEIAKRAGEAAEAAIHLGDGGPHSPGIAGFEAGTVRATTRLVDAEFPRVTQLIPDTFTAVAEVPAAAFAEGVKRVALVAERNTPVRLAFRKGSARLEAGTGDEATATEEIDVTYDDDEFTIAFQPQYLVDGLTAAGTGDTVRIHLTEPAKPAILTPAGDDSGYRYIQMPIRGAG